MIDILNGGMVGAGSRADPAERITVALADARPTLRIGTRLVLERAGMEVVAEFGSVADLRATLGQYAPRVLLTETFQPQITRVSPHTRVLVYSEDVEPPLLHAIFRAGAAGFVRKSATVEQLVAAVRAVADDGRYLEPEIAASILGGENEFLTDREKDALDLWASGHTNAEVARSLRISVRTVESVRADLRCRLGLPNRSALVRYARERL